MSAENKIFNFKILILPTLWNLLPWAASSLAPPTAMPLHGGEPSDYNHLVCDNV
jgi:hypothetical protein